MREFTSPLGVTVATTGNLTDDVVAHAAERPSVVLFSRPTSAGWGPVTAVQFHGEVRALAKGLIATGIRAGDRVAILSKTRYEWTLLDYAIWYAGAVTVPIYETSSDEQVEWILSDSGAAAIVVESSARMRRLAGVRGRLDHLNHVWSIDDNAVDVLTRLGVDVPDPELDQRRAVVGPDSLATLIYTSGTTGRPKGCMLTHGNLMFELEVAVDELDELFAGEDASTLLFLPLAHIFARIVQIGCVKAGVRLGHSADIRRLVEDLGGFEPAFILAVPRVFEKVFNTASQNAVADGRGGIFHRAAETAIAYSRALDRGGRVRPALRVRHALFDRLVYRRLRAALGGRCTYAISGGAPLGERLGHFYRGIGITVLEGYGLTETSAAVTVNRPDALRLGTVGQPLGGTSVRIGEDGEMHVRGGQVMAGYWNDEAATADVLRDGWLHTGDLGEIDDEGFVRVTGRKKEILVTAGGKNVAPATLEDRIRAHHLVSQCMVVGDGRPFIAALITLDPDAVRPWAERADKPTRPADLVDDPDLLGELQGAVDEANRAVSRAESVRKFAVLPSDWTEESGHLTPSLKLKRAVVEREVRAEIDRLYIT